MTTRNDRREDKKPYKCPWCKEGIDGGGRICPHCRQHIKWKRYNFILWLIIWGLIAIPTVGWGLLGLLLWPFCKRVVRDE